MKNKVFIVNDQRDMGRPYHPFFDYIGEAVYDLDCLDKNHKEIVLVVFTGGDDVQPILYDEDTGSHCYCNPERDQEEIEIFDKAKKLGIPMFGICRGAQFLCVMTQGKLVQHCTGHQREHNIRLNTGEKFEVSSAHHQMMIPSEDSIVLGWAEPKLSQIYLNGNDNAIDYSKEVEVVEFPSAKAFGVQYHPEIMNRNSKGYQYSQELVRKLI